ncbi:MAG: energy-coupling factor ABC transporter ATP-binding protein [Promethearchaeota archaeon]
MIIKFENVSFAYHSQVQTIHDLSFSVNEGEAMVFLGENGSGKSTIFLNLLNLVTGHTGSIRVENLEVSRKTEKQIRQRVGIIFQNSNDQLFLPTVKEEIAFGPYNLGFSGDELETRIHHAARAIGVGDILDKKIFHLSQGEKKRVAIAAVFAMNPEVYLFDEPFANLDPKTKTVLAQIMLDLHQLGKTLLLISHDLDHLPEFFNRAIVLHAGTKTFDGTLRDLYTHSEILSQANLQVPSVVKLYNLVQSKLKDRYPHLFEKLVGEISTNSNSNPKSISIPNTINEFSKVLDQTMDKILGQILD